MTADTTEREAIRFGPVLWLVIFPLLGIGLYLGVFAPNYHPAVRSAPHPVTCAQLNAEPDPLDSGGQIAPLCGDAAYPATTP